MTLLKEHLGQKEQQLLKSCDKRGLGSLQRDQCDPPGGSNGKESTCNARRSWSDPRVRKIPWRREWQPTPVFLPGESHGERSLVGYGP